ncbi:ABC transporter ATP-binding protein [Kribbella sp. NPDC048928]|uniref:ABC transporter ATP-binding protein n=1 Tax=Kribbella sp. NPDC048928 TaxID=3364111 RepID=UPI00371C04D6
MLDIRNLTVVYGHGGHRNAAVQDVSLRVEPHAIVGLVGESGSGKSTLGKAVVSLAPVSAGTIEWNGAPVAVRWNARRGTARPAIQYVFQDPYASLNPRLRVGGAIAEGLGDHRRSGRRAEVERLLELVRLDPEVADVLPRQLSGGQRQRVAIARALAAEPELLIADEITSALDVSVQGAVLNLLKEIQAETGVAILFISHNLAVVRYLAGSVAVMKQGRMVEFGPTDQVVGSPSDPYTQQLLQAVPALRR